MLLLYRPAVQKDGLGGVACLAFSRIRILQIYRKPTLYGATALANHGETFSQLTSLFTPMATCRHMYSVLILTAAISQGDLLV
jgi:hypothetical protein